MPLQKGQTFHVLDHGYVKLVDWMGDDTDVVRAARTSTGRGFEGWGPGEVCSECRARKDEEGHVPDCQSSDNPTWAAIPGDEFLLEYLLSNKHTTPFEMCELKLLVQAPILAFREWHRHRTQSYSEFSARYSKMENLHYLPELRRICKQSTTNKQGSAEPFPEDYANDVLRQLDLEQQGVYDHYDRLVCDGVAKEVARLNTPVARYSRMYVKTDLWNWFAFLNLRHDPSAQWEIRQFANVISDIIKELFPRCHHLWEEHMRYAVRFSRTEHVVLQMMMKHMPETFQAALSEMSTATLGEKKAKAFIKKLTTPRE